MLMPILGYAYLCKFIDRVEVVAFLYYLLMKVETQLILIIALYFASFVFQQPFSAH